MDFKKRVITLLSLCGFFTITIILGLFFSGKNVQNRAVEKYFLDGFNVKKVVQVDIKNDKTSVLLSKVDNRWKVEYGSSLENVDDLKIADFFNNIKKLKVGKKITKNSDKYADFGLGENASKIAFTYDDGSQIALLIGSMLEGDYENQYIMLEGKEQVYLTSAIIESTYSNRDWVNLNVFGIKEANQIASISIKGVNPIVDESIKAEERNLNYTLIKTSEDNSSNLVWKKDGSEDKIDQNSVTSFCSSIINLNADDILSPSTKMTENQAAVSIKITTLDGANKTLFISKTEDSSNRYICYLDSLDKSFYISKYSLKNLLKYY